MPKKYLVYISSADDLKNERQDLVKLVTELGHIPVTMDSFDIKDETDQKYIRKTIGESDYFLNLTAHKCGEIMGKSCLLEIELEWAEKFGLPIIALIIEDGVRWKDSKKEKSPAALKLLGNLKKRLRTHNYDAWANVGEIREKTSYLLIREMTLNPRRGWVPADEAIDPAAANELGRLVRENEVLKNRIKFETTGGERRMRDRIKRTLKILAANKVSLSFRYESREEWENTTEFRCLRIFKLLSPELSIPKSTADISRFLGNVLNPDLEKTVRKDYPAPTNTIKKIMADLNLLDLVKCSGDGDDEAWEITEYGKETYAAYRMHQLERNLKNIIAGEDQEA